jgi:homoserine O-succinyltransferase
MSQLHAEFPPAKVRPKERKVAGIPDTRPLRIGVLSLSNSAETRLIEPLSRAALPVHPIQIRLGTADQTVAEVAFIRGAPVSFTRAILDGPLDGLVLAGTPEEDVAPEELPRWRELTEILDYARGFIPSTLGLGDGGLALARVLGLELVRLDRALSGYVPLRSLPQSHALLGSSEVFFAAHRRRFRIADESFENADARRRVTPLAYSREAGVSIFETADRRFIAHLGRPEGLAPMKEPAPLSAFLDSAKESARAHAEGFFSGWVRRLHEVARAHVLAAR